VLISVGVVEEEEDFIMEDGLVAEVVGLVVGMAVN
jgi:hypothetical protein